MPVMSRPWNVFFGSVTGLARFGWSATIFLRSAWMSVYWRYVVRPDGSADGASAAAVACSRAR